MATIAFGAGAVRLRYDHNLLNLQPRHLESADIERELFGRLDDSVWYAVSVCSTPEELKSRKAQFEKLSVVAKTEEIASLVPDHLPQHAQRIEALCHRIAALPQQPAWITPIDVKRLRQELARAGDLLAKTLPYESRAGALLVQLQAALAAAPAEEVSARLAQGQTAAATRIATSLTPLRELADPSPPQLEDLPRELRDRFVGLSGTYLLKVYARGNIWNMNEMQAFIRAVESVDPRVTGHPVQTYYASRQMQQSYLRAGLYALVAVLVILWIDFRSLAHSLLAMIPLAIGFVQMCGVIGWLDLPLNAANMIVLPLILGIGVDHGVHLVHHWRQQRGPFALGDSTAIAVILTAATTTASFGALILARHQGLQSLGQVLTLGVTTCLASSILFFPAILSWLSPKVQSRLSDHADPKSLPAANTFANAGMELAPAPPEAAESAESQIETGPAPHAIPLPPLPPAQVTDDEVAALLENALIPRQLRVSTTVARVATDEDAAVRPRQRDLPRRSDAA
jgi:hypothetical protein